MPKNKSKSNVEKNPFRPFVWNPDTETWSQSDFDQYDKANWFEAIPGAHGFIQFEHRKNVQGRPWAVYTHPRFPGVYFGNWEDAGPHVPPYA